MEPVESKMTTITVFALRDGGYMIRETPEWSGQGAYNPPLFACSSMNELLAYLRRHLGWTTKK